MSFDLKKMFRIPTAEQRLAGLDLRPDLAKAALDMVTDERSDRHLKAFGDRLTASESVLCIVEGERAHQLGFLALTSQRVLFAMHGATGDRVDALALEDVVEVREHNRRLTGQVTIVDTTGRELRVDKLLQAAQFAQALRRRLAGPETCGPEIHDPLQELLDLRERRAAGTINDSDYQAAKRRLLDEL